MNSRARNRQLAGQARAEADQHPAGSLRRRAWACCSIALQETSSITAARKVLTEEMPETAVQTAALTALDQLTSRPRTSPSGAGHGNT